MELFTMWRSTRMVVLTSISAALYAAALIAFKFMSILPGVTEVRPGVAFVLLCSLLFGPAGAWGAAIGNTIGDLAGGLGPGTAVGFAANLLFGWVPYRLLRQLGVDDPTPAPDRPRALYGFVAAALTGSAVAAMVVGYGIQAFGLWPAAFQWLGLFIFLTNSLVTVLLGFFLARAICPRVTALGLRYQDILDMPPVAPRRTGDLAASIAVVSILGALILGLAGEWGRIWGIWTGAPSLHILVPVSLVVAVAALARPD
jgi:energy-coupling factor transport system substrate-specific component